jgi:hypothetical protein
VKNAEAMMKPFQINEYTKETKDSSGDPSSDQPSFIHAQSSVQSLDELCSAMAWNANTGAIFAKNDLPLVETSTALEAVGGDISFLVWLSIILKVTENEICGNSYLF